MFKEPSDERGGTVFGKDEYHLMVKWSLTL